MKKVIRPLALLMSFCLFYPKIALSLKARGWSDFKVLVISAPFAGSIGAIMAEVDIRQGKNITEF